MIYIIVFAISLLLLYASIKAKKKPAKILFFALSIIIPCILASLRSINMTVDTMIYIEPLFKIAKKANFFDYIFNNGITNDVLYLIVSYVCAKISSSISVLFFAMELLVLAPLYIAIRRRYDKPFYVVLAAMAALALLYNASFNMARQAISLSFFVLAVEYLFEGKNKKYWLLSIAAFFMHWSAFIAFPIAFIIHRIKVSDKKTITGLGFVAIAIVGFFIVGSMNTFLNAINLGNLKIVEYISNHSMTEYTSNATADTLFFVFIYIVIKLFRRPSRGNNKNEDDAFSLLTLLGLIVMQYGAFIEYGFRLSYYFLYPVLILYVPKICETQKRNNAVILTLTIFMSLIFYWVFWVIISNYHDTYPFIMAR